MVVLKTEWLLTRRCNLHCNYCKIRDDSSLLEKELSFEEVIIGVEYINKRFPGTIIVFFGGEPTVFDWLPELVRFCNDIGQYYAVISNSIRVLEDKEYFAQLLFAPIKNWSVSIDCLNAIKYPYEDLKQFDFIQSDFMSASSRLKSFMGMKALLKMKKFGVQDLVACISVNKYNILDLPEMIRLLTNEGIWSITSPLQIGGFGFEYSSDSVGYLKCMDKYTIKKIAKELYKMAKSGNYLMHNHKEYYALWEEGFISANWKCKTKSSLTIDADGSLKRCVERKGNLAKFNILTLKDNEREYEMALQEEVRCRGCLWDPAIQTSFMAKNMNIEDAKRMFRHE